jgi:hypothetical protein
VVALFEDNDDLRISYQKLKVINSNMKQVELELFKLSNTYKQSEADLCYVFEEFRRYQLNLIFKPINTTTVKHNVICILEFAKEYFASKPNFQKALYEKYMNYKAEHAEYIKESSNLKAEYAIYLKDYKNYSKKFMSDADLFLCHKINWLSYSLEAETQIIKKEQPHMLGYFNKLNTINDKTLLAENILDTKKTV